MPKKVQPPKNLELYVAESNSPVSNSFIGEVKAGFPSPAGDFINESIDLNKYVSIHPANTFYARANGTSMEEDFSDGDLLVIDRLQEFRGGKIVICYIDG